MVILPLLDPHDALLVVVARAVGPATFVIVRVVVNVQPFASCTVIV